MMEKNVGQTDRLIRAILGAVLVVAFFMTSGGLSWVLLILGIILLGTAAMSSCLIYSILGMNTCKTK